MRRAMMTLLAMTLAGCTSGGDAGSHGDTSVTTTGDTDTSADGTVLNPYAVKRDHARVCPGTDDPSAQGSCSEDVSAPACDTHGDCASGEVCSYMTGLYGPRCECLPLRCLSDSDCGPGLACECAQVRPDLVCGYFEDYQRCAARCVRADCDSDADCDPGAFCVAAVAHFGHIPRYVCSDPGDPGNTCANDSDCDTGACVWNGRWRCEARPVH